MASAVHNDVTKEILKHVLCLVLCLVARSIQERRYINKDASSRLKHVLGLRHASTSYLGTVERSLTSSAARAPETAERRINAALEKSCDFMLAVAAGNNNMYW